MSALLLSAEDLHIQFGGVKAIDGVTLGTTRHEFLAIIGPNGSGKTTFLNLCTGYLKPLRGHVFFEGRDITRLSPRAIVKEGIARSFQIPQLFTRQTLLENLLIAVAARNGFWDPVSPLNRPAYRREAMENLALVGIESCAHSSVLELPPGARKLADIAMALALRPRLLLLDEPTSGVSAGEKFSIMETLMRALREQRMTTVFVEHDMEIVRRYAQRVAVFDRGGIVAQGVPEQVLNDPRVLESVVGVT